MNPRTIVKKVVPKSVFKRVEPVGHLGEAILAQAMSGFPARGLKVIGVTGTDGKTTTATMIAHMLKTSGKKVALITTVSIDYGDGKGSQANTTRLTTFGAVQMAKIFKRIKANGVEWVVLETSSHSLAQHRVFGVPYSIVVFTNLSPEHLDYHGLFERYRAAKVQLFKLCNRNLRGMRLGIVNADDDNAKYFVDAIKNSVTYGIEKGDLLAKSIKASSSGAKYSAVVDKDKYNIEVKIPGKFNIYNSMAAVAVGRAVGLTPKQIEKGIASLSSVEGRMMRVDLGQKYDVIIDYAHTPDSFEKLFKEIRPLTKGKLICVFGSAGRRDEAKRERQGELAGRYCDVVVVTEEDDRDEDGNAILKEIAEGAMRAIKTEGKIVAVVRRREDAVAKAIGMAKKGDTVLLLGKGHESSILSNGPQAAELRHLPQDDNDKRRVIKRPYSELETAKKAIKSKA